MAERLLGVGGGRCKGGRFHGATAFFAIAN